MNHNVHDVLFVLWRSTRNLAERFNQQRTAKTQTPLVHEEVREFLHEATVHNVNRDALAGEAADVFVVVIGMLQAHGVGYEEMETAILRTVEKNDSKTADTHALDLRTNKITRLERAG